MPMPSHVKSMPPANDLMPIHLGRESRERKARLIFRVHDKAKLLEKIRGLFEASSSKSASVYIYMYDCLDLSGGLMVVPFWLSCRCRTKELEAAARK